jgi:hypothetical protein
MTVVVACSNGCIEMAILQFMPPKRRYRQIDSHLDSPKAGNLPTLAIKLEHPLVATIHLLIGHHQLLMKMTSLDGYAAMDC